MNEELPQVYRHHVFCCFQQRPPNHPRGSCAAVGAKPLWEHLGAKLQNLQMPDVAMTSSGCLGFCQAGPLMVVYPQGVWYRPQSTDDVDEIIESHLRNDTLVDRLAIILK